MRAILAIAVNPAVYVVGFALVGAACIVAGINALAGAGFALIASGAFLIAGAAFIMRGLTPNG